MIETESDLPGAPKEISFYTNEAYYCNEPSRTRRHTVRLDGFVSAWAGLKGGEILTAPIRFDGGQLEANVSTSAAGLLRVQILDENARAIDGFSFEDCDDFFGDTVAHTVTWKGSDDVSSLAGKPIRLCFALSDADLYSYRFF